MSKKKPPCLYCGNAPTSHFVSFVIQTILVPLTPLTRFSIFLENSIFGKIFKIILIPYIKLFEILRFISWNKDKEKAKTERSKVIWIEAEKRNIPMEQLVILGKPVEQYRAKIRNKWFYFESLPIPPNLPAKSYAWMDSKWILKNFLEKHSIPIPRGLRMVSKLQLSSIFESLDKPLIVKPELGSRGRHTTTHIYTKEDLEHGFDVGKVLCHFLIAEEMLLGSVYRGTYVGGEIVGILRGDPPRITGDGVSDIQTLIENKNQNKPEKVKDVVVTEKTLEFLGRQNLNLESVLEKGKTIDLSEKIGLSYGGNAVEMIDVTHQDILNTLKKAGDVLNAPVVGFDFIIPDPTKDPKSQKWGIIEANSLPFINLHHFPLEGTPVNIASKIWDLWN